MLSCSSIETITRDFPTRSDIPSLAVWTKADLASPVDRNDAIAVSAETSSGLEKLRGAIASRLRSNAMRDNRVFHASARVREGLALAEGALDSAILALVRGAGDEFVAVDLREAIDELGKIVGAVATDEILDRIFSRFCIGK